MNSKQQICNHLILRLFKIKAIIQPSKHKRLGKVNKKATLGWLFCRRPKRAIKFKVPKPAKTLLRTKWTSLISKTGFSDVENLEKSCISKYGISSLESLEPLELVPQIISFILFNHLVRKLFSLFKRLEFSFKGQTFSIIPPLHLKGFQSKKTKPIKASPKKHKISPKTHAMVK